MKLLGKLLCIIVEIYYWFRFPTGYPVSGHSYVEQDNGSLKCQRCGKVSE